MKKEILTKLKQKVYKIWTQGQLPGRKTETLPEPCRNAVRKVRVSLELKLLGVIKNKSLKRV